MFCIGLHQDSKCCIFDRRVKCVILSKGKTLLVFTAVMLTFKEFLYCVFVVTIVLKTKACGSVVGGSMI